MLARAMVQAIDQYFDPGTVVIAGPAALAVDRGPRGPRLRKLMKLLRGVWSPAF